MKKHLKHLFLFGIVLTALLFAYSCKEEEGNQPPLAPSGPSPANNDDSVSPAPVLSWLACADPESDSVKYDVYLGTVDPPALVSSNLLVNSYSPDTLLPNTKYYWKVIAKDNKNNASVSPVWIFTTGDPILPPGDLEIFVTNQAGTSYYGGASVYLYKSYADRLNDPTRTNAFRSAMTDNADPINIGATFYALPYQKYYLFVKWTDMTKTYTGEGECFVPLGKKTKVIITIS